ncbi:MAG TPA: hypothetical protein VN809_04765, partial [Telmatospirillum sp.]|nr:hypothetical protein [Telmatospirillum sp.]
QSFQRLQLICAAWAVPVIGACAVLVIPHTESALFITFILPNIFYLALPMSFRWTLAAGLGCSIVVLTGYIAPAPLSEVSVGLVLGMLTINVILVLVVVRTSRLQRLEWLATRAERIANKELSAQQDGPLQ